MFNKIQAKIEEATKARSGDPQVISYQTLRKTVGWLGILLPFALVLGSVACSACWNMQPSISHYYYTNMREIFVGTLCAVSLFLFSYKGMSKVDSWSANIAGLFGLGVALFPTNIIKDYPFQGTVTPFINLSFSSTIHFTCAALFFLTLSFMSLFLFTKSSQPKSEQTPAKRKRNIIYKICGIVMILCVVVIGVYAFMTSKSEKETVLVFTCETIALLAFGFSWLTKGEGLLKD